jgi:putative solute:sodium symporter small subunit
MPETPSKLDYWRRVRRLTAALLLVWLVVAFGLVCEARTLNGFSFFGWPLGFWVAAQGALLVFLALVVIYAWVMDRIEKSEQV